MPKILEIDISITGDQIYGPITLNNNTSQVAATFSTSNKFIQLQYSLFRNGITRTGRLLITIDGTNTIASLTDDYTKTTDIGVTFSHQIVGSDLQLIATSTNLGSNSTFKYYQKLWS